MKTAYFAGGCFWCITPTFQEMEGVARVTSGYSGGEEIDPTYEDVKHQRTGHRETIRIDYDSRKVSFTELFEILAIPTLWRFTTGRKRNASRFRKESKRWKKKADEGCASA